MDYETVPDCQVKGMNEIYLKYFGYKTDGIFVEGGAFDGHSISNTWGLAHAGWRGLYIEPIPENAKACKLNHSSHKNITTLQLALGNYTGTVIMYVAAGNSTYSSILRNSELCKNEYKENIKITVPITTLDKILEENNIPIGFDVLVIDTECSEIQVLEGFTLSKWIPKMVIIEAHEYSEYKELTVLFPSINKFFESYEKIYSDEINNIYWKGN